jgi:hypothetical protein
MYPHRYLGRGAEIVLARICDQVSCKLSTRALPDRFTGEEDFSACICGVGESRLLILKVNCQQFLPVRSLVEAVLHISVLSGEQKHLVAHLQMHSKNES